MSGKPIPDKSIVSDCDHLGAFNGKRRWRSKNKKRLYEWDALHGEFEVYNFRGKHLGAVDPITGEMKKDAKKGREIDV